MKYPTNVFTLQLVVCEPSDDRASMQSIRSPEDIGSLLSPLRKASEEKFLAVFLNAAHEVIGLTEVSHGTLSSSLVHPREVFKAALLANAHAIIVAHNHPSGTRLNASREDLTTTEQLVAAGALMGIQVLDHVIVGPMQSEVFSIRENHPEVFAKA